MDIPTDGYFVCQSEDIDVASPFLAIMNNAGGNGCVPVLAVCFYPSGLISRSGTAGS